MPWPRTQHRNNVPILRGKKHDIYLKILHQVGFETVRQAVALTKRRALTTIILPRPSQCNRIDKKMSMLIVDLENILYNFSTPVTGQTPPTLWELPRMTYWVKKATVPRRRTWWSYWLTACPRLPRRETKWLRRSKRLLISEKRGKAPLSLYMLLANAKRWTICI